MLALFKNIRSRLLQENKIWGYLKYAAGEILLVVIGILIAIQINGSYEKGISKQKELSYLQEIRSNLVTDTVNIKAVIAFTLKKVEAIEETSRLFELGAKGKSYQHEMPTVMPMLADFRVFSPVRVAFSNMMSAENIELISDKKIRNLITVYYDQFDDRDGTQNRHRQLTRDFIDTVSPRLINKENIFRRFGREINIRSADQVAIHEDEMVIGKLFNMSMICNRQINDLKKTREQIKHLIEVIDN